MTQCNASTKSGAQCKRTATEGAATCAPHTPAVETVRERERRLFAARKALSGPVGRMMDPRLYRAAKDRQAALVRYERPGRTRQQAKDSTRRKRAARDRAAMTAGR